MSYSVYIGRKDTEINIGNRNASIIFPLVGAIANADTCVFEFDPVIVLERIKQIRMENRVEEFCPVTEQDGNFISCGLNPDNFRQRLDQLERAAMEAIESGEQMIAL
jgi:hypothetical protein